MEKNSRISFVVVAIFVVWVNACAPAIVAPTNTEPHPTFEASTLTSNPSIIPPTPVAIFVTATSQLTPQPTLTPVLLTDIPTPAIPIPEGLLPSTLTPAFFDSLYQQAISKASSDIPTATFAEIQINVYPFGSESWPGVTTFLKFKMGGDLYSYQWNNESNDLVYQGKTHYFIIGSGEGTCSILPWQRKSGWEELVRFGYFTIHKSFPIDVKSHYFLDAMAWERECRWSAYFWYDTEHLGNFVLNESGPSGQ